MSPATLEPDPLADFFAHCPAMLFATDLTGAILRSSAALGHLLGPEADAGVNLHASVHPDDRGAFEAAWARLVDGDDTVSIDLRLRGADGVYRASWMSARRSPLLGEIHGEIQARDSSLPKDMKRDAKLLRALLDTILFAVWMVDPQGIVTFSDGKAMGTVGHTPGQFVGMNFFDLLPDTENADLMRGALAGTPARLFTEVEGHPMENWYVPIRDDQGQVEGVVGVAMSLAEAKRTERELRDRIATIERQRQVIREMSTPIIEVWDKVLTVPMLGVVDTMRAADLMENLLLEVSRKGSRFAILDLTGVAAMDTSTASHLLKLVQALKLLGAEAIVTGIQPSVAQTMVALGVDMESITTQAKLRDGLRLCMRWQREGREGRILRAGKSAPPVPEERR